MRNKKAKQLRRKNLSLDVLINKCVRLKTLVIEHPKLEQLLREEIN